VPVLRAALRAVGLPDVRDWRPGAATRPRPLPIVCALRCTAARAVRLLYLPPGAAVFVQFGRNFPDRRHSSHAPWTSQLTASPSSLRHDRWKPRTCRTFGTACECALHVLHMLYLPVWLLVSEVRSGHRRDGFSIEVGAPWTGMSRGMKQAEKSMLLGAGRLHWHLHRWRAHAPRPTMQKSLQVTCSKKPASQVRRSWQ
jgi:hypothetical protein